MKRTCGLLLGLLALTLPGMGHGLRPSLDAPGIVTAGPRAAREVALTFDADMTPGMEGELRTGRVRSFYNAAVVRIRAPPPPSS